MTEHKMQELGSYLRQHREALGLSIRALAPKIGVDKKQIIRLEAGRTISPSADLLARIAQQLGLPLSEVYGRAGFAAFAELPSFRPYLRAKYQDLPADALTELEATFDEIARKYGTTGPRPGEDEQ